tara:strand:- start:964 stop:1467 length:504 start_codon:yes stop_codon:yes gene_type:complete
LLTQKEKDFISKKLSSDDEFDYEKTLETFNKRRERDNEPPLSDQDILDHLSSNDEPETASSSGMPDSSKTENPQTVADGRVQNMVRNQIQTRASTQANRELAGLITRKVIDYRIVDGSNSSQCAANVRTAIKAGWEPIGGICFAERGMGSSLTAMKTHFQAMVKYQK